MILRGFTRDCVSAVWGGGFLERDAGKEDGDEDGVEDEEKWYFYLEDFVHMEQSNTADMHAMMQRLGDLNIESAVFFEELARDHERRPAEGRFGYRVTTHDGYLTQENAWTSTWEGKFRQNMERMLRYDLEISGPR